MKYLKLLAFNIFLFVANQSLYAQFWKKIQKKLEKKVEQKVEQKIDKETDKLLDSTLYGKRKRNDEGKPTSNVPKFTSDTGILLLYNHGYEYKTKDISISVYGKFDKTNLSKSIKSYNSNRVIAPVDALPAGYVLANNDDGYLNPKEGQVQIHHADSTKIVYSLKGTWNTFEGNKPVNGSYVSLSVADIVDKRNTSKERSIKKDKNTNESISNDTSNKITTSGTTSPTINIPSSFSFNKNISVEVTTDRGEKQTIDFLIGNYPDIYGISVASKEMQGQGKVVMVMTPKSSTAFMDVAGMKMKKTTSLDQMGDQFNVSDQLPEDGDFVYKKTGNTKTILGYNCDEYKVDYKYANDEGSASFWVSKDFPIQNKALPMLGMSINNTNFSGFVLELNSTHQGRTTNMKVTDVANINTTINSNEFRKMGF